MIRFFMVNVSVSGDTETPERMDGTMKCKKLLAFLLTAAMFVSTCSGVFAAANVSETDASAPPQQTEAASEPTPEEVIVTTDGNETVTVSEQMTDANELPHGRMGENAYWYYNADTQLLSVLGNGKIGPGTMDYDSSWRNYLPYITKILIDEGITDIADNTFYSDYVFADGGFWKPYISSVLLPSTLKTIGKGAFSECDRLTSLTVPASVEKIGFAAFYRCSALKSVTIESGSRLTQIGNEAYDEDESWSYEYGAFEECTALEKVVLPDSLKVLGQDTFKNCSQLGSVTFGNRLTTVAEGAFEGCTALTSLSIPGSVRYLGSFSGCTSLTSVVMSNGVTHVGDFKDCTSLTSIVIPDSVTHVGSFSGCTSLTSIVIPDSVTETWYWNDTYDRIFSMSFSGCTSLSSVTLSRNLKSIPESAFSGCSSLKYITIPASVVDIDNEAFANCTALRTVTFAPGSRVRQVGDFDDDDSSGVFKNCTSLQSIDLPERVTFIPKGTFEGCKSLTGIGFSYCMDHISPGAFDGCTALKKITYGGTQEGWDRYVKSDLPDWLKSQAQVTFRNYADSTVTSLTILEKPAQQTYEVGETLDWYGYRLVATYQNGDSSKDVFDEWQWDGAIVSGYVRTPSGELTTPGQQKVTVNYGGKTVSHYVTVTPKAKKVSSVAVKTMPSKTVYTAGDSLNTSGLRLKVTYTDDTAEEITSGFTCSPTKLNTPGKQTVTVSYGEKSATFTVTVNQPTLSSVTVSQKPSKTAYVAGDTLNTSGLKLTAAYSNGTTKEITSGFTCTPTKLNTLGQQTVTVSYGGKSASFTVTVNEPPVSSVTISKKPTKLTYWVGDSFNSAGMKLKITYTNNTTKEITSGFTCTPTKMTTTGQQKIVVSYGGKATGFYVTVNALTVTSVAVSQKPAQLIYAVGEAFNPAGMKLKVTYSNNSTKEITSGFTCTPTKMTAAGEQKIVVSYSGKATGFFVTVKTVKQIRVSQKPAKTTYEVANTLNTAGMKVKVTFSDDTTREITSGFVCTPTKMEKAGNQWITVKFGGTATAFPVKVKEPTVAKIRVTKKPTKTTYIPGNSLNTSGMEVTVTYSNDTTKVITDGFTCAPTKFTAEGLRWITVKYGGTATAFPVNVVKKAKTIRVIQKPSKTTYIAGNSINTAGLKLRATYDDGSTKDITSGFVCTPAKLTAVGNQWITVTYAGQSTAFPVKVEPKAKTVRITQQPTKKNYYVGDTLNTSGMKLTATYDDGTTKVVTSGFVCSPVVLNKAGNQWITVIYAGQSTAFPVKVTKPVSSVTIKKLPTKRTYKVGETFNSSGMVLKVTYTDKTTAELTSGFTCTPSSKLNTKGQQKIIVTYGGKATGFYVTVA